MRYGKQAGVLRVDGARVGALLTGTVGATLERRAQRRLREVARLVAGRGRRHVRQPRERYSQANFDPRGHQTVSYFTVPPRAHLSTGSQSGSATPGLTQVPSTCTRSRSRGDIGPALHTQMNTARGPLDPLTTAVLDQPPGRAAKRLAPPGRLKRVLDTAHIFTHPPECPHRSEHRTVVKGIAEALKRAGQAHNLTHNPFSSYSKPRLVCSLASSVNFIL